MYTLILISKLTPRTQVFGTYGTYQEAWDHLQKILEKDPPEEYELLDIIQDHPIPFEPKGEKS